MSSSSLPAGSVVPSSSWSIPALVVVAGAAVVDVVVPERRLASEQSGIDGASAFWRGTGPPDRDGSWMGAERYSSAASRW
jgi:hypothetical protein